MTVIVESHFSESPMAEAFVENSFNCQDGSESRHEEKDFYDFCFASGSNYWTGLECFAVV